MVAESDGGMRGPWIDQGWLAALKPQVPILATNKYSGTVCING